MFFCTITLISEFSKIFSKLKEHFNLGFENAQGHTFQGTKILSEFTGISHYVWDFPLWQNSVNNRFQNTSINGFFSFFFYYFSLPFC